MDRKVVEILLIEDNVQDAELTIRALKKNNLTHHVLHIRDSAEALRFIFEDSPAPVEGKNNFKLILLDLKMPKLSGIEVLKKLKSDERTWAIPVVILTSSKQESDIAQALRTGANSYVVKPVAFDQFVDAVIQIGSYWLTLNQSTR